MKEIEPGLDPEHKDEPAPVPAVTLPASSIFILPLGIFRTFLMTKMRRGKTQQTQKNLQDQEGLPLVLSLFSCVFVLPLPLPGDHPGS